MKSNFQCIDIALNSKKGRFQAQLTCRINWPGKSLKFQFAANHSLRTTAWAYASGKRRRTPSSIALIGPRASPDPGGHLLTQRRPLVRFERWPLGGTEERDVSYLELICIFILSVVALVLFSRVER
jgi:hypothetical protein